MGIAHQLFSAYKLHWNLIIYFLLQFITLMTSSYHMLYLYRLIKCILNFLTNLLFLLNLLIIFVSKLTQFVTNMTVIVIVNSDAQV